jgi:hypothetical protein
MNGLAIQADACTKTSQGGARPRVVLGPRGPRSRCEQGEASKQPEGNEALPVIGLRTLPTSHGTRVSRLSTYRCEHEQLIRAEN